MTLLRLPIIVLVVAVLFIVVPLYFSQFYLESNFAWILIILQSIVWMIIYQVIIIGKRFKMDPSSLALGGLVGIKLALTMISFVLLFLLGFFSSKLTVWIYLLIYALYTPAIYYWGNKLIKQP